MGAAALPWVAAGLGVFGAAQQMSAANDAKKAARENARMQAEQNAEEARRLQMEQEEVESRTRAAIAASGTGMGSTSQLAFLDKMKAEHQAELQWLRRSGQSRTNSTLREGETASRQASSSAFSTLANTATGAYSAFGPKG